MCHGVFDVVHPGHIRHLSYAKSKAHILVASITADIHVDKGVYRPHIPQDLRALNLAALEAVDYVVIDDNPTPLANIAYLQPDYFAKGYEYYGNTKTHAESEILAQYGGKLILTPGDITYSSSKLIEDKHAPSLRYEKLLSLMERNNIKFSQLNDTVQSFGHYAPKVHVVGDTIIDTITYTTLYGGQTKTPTISVLYESQKSFVGGAGIVAKHVAAAGAKVVFSTVLGNDSFGEMAKCDLEEANIECHVIIDSTRPTTQKNAIVCGGQRLLKLDTLDNRPISDDIVIQLCGTRDLCADAVIFTDFRHGIFHKRTIPVLMSELSAPFIAADSQVASRWGNILDFNGIDLITPNEREARFALADQDSGVRPLASALYEQAKCKTLIMKLGERGILAIGKTKDPFVVLDSFTDNVVDPVGAGDALLAYAVLAKLITGSDVQAAILGSIASALECERDGNIPITATDVLTRLYEIEKQVHYR